MAQTLYSFTVIDRLRKALFYPRKGDRETWRLTYLSVLREFGEPSEQVPAERPEGETRREGTGNIAGGW